VKLILLLKPTNIEYESGDQVGSFDEKSRSQILVHCNFDQLVDLSVVVLKIGFSSIQKYHRPPGEACSSSISIEGRIKEGYLLVNWLFNS
jgi:hypothetical protein